MHSTNTATLNGPLPLLLSHPLTAISFCCCDTQQLSLGHAMAYQDHLQG